MSRAVLLALCLADFLLVLIALTTGWSGLEFEPAPGLPLGNLVTALGLLAVPAWQRCC